jgi:type IV pilus assembly protein PilO
MANLREVSRKLRIIMAILVGFNVLALGALVYMWVRGTSALPDEFTQLHQQVVNRKGAVVGPEVVTQRVKESREQIAKFYEDRLPRNSSTIFESLGSLARENRVNLTQASYKVDQTDMPNVSQVEITADLNGDYAQTMRFINALEREKLFFIVDGVNLAEQEGGRVKLNIRIQAFMKGQA